MNPLQIINGCYVRAESLSNFTLRVVRVEPSERGFHHRIVKVKVVGEKESPAIFLPIKALASALNFRVWLLGQFANAQWTGGEKELDALRVELGNQTVRVLARQRLPKSKIPNRKPKIA